MTSETSGIVDASVHAPTAVPIPASVSRVLSRRRRMFFKTNPANDNDLAMSWNASFCLRVEES